MFIKQTPKPLSTIPKNKKLIDCPRKKISLAKRRLAERHQNPPKPQGGKKTLFFSTFTNKDS